MPPVSDLVGRWGKTAWNPNKKSPSQVLSNACQHVCTLKEAQFGNCFVDPHEEVRVWTWIWAMSGKEWTSLVAQLVKNLPAVRRLGFYPWAGKISWRREKLPIPVFRSGEYTGHGITKSWTGLSDFCFSLSFWEIVEDGGAWCVTTQGVANNRTQPSDWTTKKRLGASLLNSKREACLQEAVTTLSSPSVWNHCFKHPSAWSGPFLSCRR